MVWSESESERESEGESEGEGEGEDEGESQGTRQSPAFSMGAVPNQWRAVDKHSLHPFSCGLLS